MAKTRKRTGAHRRRQQQKFGPPKPPDENKVRTAQQATVFWVDTARAELVTGFTYRVTPAANLAVLPMVNDACAKYGREFAERNLPPVLVAGIQPIAKELDDIVSLKHAPEQQVAEVEPEQLVLAEAYKFAGLRRKSVARVARGEKNMTLRHAFGTHAPMRPGSLEEVHAACLALISGRAAHPNSAAAKLITVGDVKKAKELVARMNEIRSQQGAQKSTSGEVARRRDVLHAALELFYDRFAAAVNLALENDDATRIALLQLIPRRKETRKAAQKPPVQAALPLTGTK